MVLQERGLWTHNLRLQRKPETNRLQNRCARHVLEEAQPDFKYQEIALQLVLRVAGHTFTRHPKFHWECNFIERYWGAAKRTARQECDYSFNSLCQKFHGFLGRVPLAVIRRFARKAWRYIDAYRQGMTADLAEFCGGKKI